MHELPNNSLEETALKFWYYSLHKTLGMAAFLVAIVRVVWAIVQPHPKPLNSAKKMENLAAQTVHWTLYGAIILMPLTGWLHHSTTKGFARIWWPFPQGLPFVPVSEAWASFFSAAHFFTGILLGLCIVLHIAGAIKHTIVDHDSTLARMVPGMNAQVPANIQEPYFKRLPVLLAVFSFLAVGIATLAINWPGSPKGTQVTKNPNSTNNGPSAWWIDPEKSKIAIQIVQAGAPVTGYFKKWNAAITFDPKKLDIATVQAEVTISSLSLGPLTEQAVSATFLNAALYPVATFVSSKFVRTGGTSYEARGQLTLAGQTKPLTLPFDLKIENGRAFVRGEAKLDRLAFGIGKNAFSTGTSVGLEVVVTVIIEADEKPPA